MTLHHPAVVFRSSLADCHGRALLPPCSHSWQSPLASLLLQERALLPWNSHIARKEPYCHERAILPWKSHIASLLSFMKEPSCHEWALLPPCSYLQTIFCILHCSTQGLSFKCHFWHFRIISLFCKRALQKRRFSAKETYNFKEPVIVATPYQSNVILDALGWVILDPLRWVIRDSLDWICRQSFASYTVAQGTMGWLRLVGSLKL